MTDEFLMEDLIRNSSDGSDKTFNKIRLSSNFKRNIGNFLFFRSTIFQMYIMSFTFNDAIIIIYFKTPLNFEIAGN